MSVSMSTANRLHSGFLHRTGVMNLMELSPEVRRYAELMQTQIDANEESKGESWKSDDLIQLVHHLRDEVDEFSSAVFKGFPDEMIEEEGADIGAMAMFIMARVVWLKRKSLR